MAKVAALRGGVRMEKSSTAKILKTLLEDVEEAGASVVFFSAERLDVKPFEAEMYCWASTEWFSFVKLGGNEKAKQERAVNQTCEIRNR